MRHPDISQARRALTDVIPPSTQAWLTFAFASTFLALTAAYTTKFAYLFVAAWLSFAVFHHKSVLEAVQRTPTIWIFSGITALSTVWSPAQGLTLRLSLELVLTVFISVIVARHLTPRYFVSSMMCSLMVIAALNVVVGHSQLDVMTGTVTFAGIFLSHNGLAFFSELLLLSALTTMADPGQPRWFRLLSVVCQVGAIVLLIRTRSATSIITATVAVLFFLVNLVFSRMRTADRARVIFALTVISIPISIVLLQFAADLPSGVLSFFGKSASMSGRTELWHRAFQLMPEHLWLGWGYQGFWVPDFVEAEALWARFGITTQSGFHFHNTLIEVAIELGLFGAAVFCYFMLGSFVRVMVWSWTGRSVAASGFAALQLLLMVRFISEIDVLGPLQYGTFVAFAIMTYGYDGCRQLRPRDAMKLQAGFSAAVESPSTGGRAIPV